jgi:hypothetical protein
LAEYLLAAIAPSNTTQSLSLITELDKLEASLFADPPDQELQIGVKERLQALIQKIEILNRERKADALIVTKIEAATDDEIFDFIDNELGIS